MRHSILSTKEQNRMFFEDVLTGQKKSNINFKYVLKYLFEQDNDWLVDTYPEIILKYPEHLV